MQWPRYVSAGFSGCGGVRGDAHVRSSRVLGDARVRNMRVRGDDGVCGVPYCLCFFVFRVQSNNNSSATRLQTVIQ